MHLSVRLGKYRDGKGLVQGTREAVSDALSTWGSSQVRRIKGAFDVGGHQQHGGAPWPPDKDGPPVLVKTGALKESITHKVEGSEVTLVAGKPYASYHHFGIGQKKRPIIVVTNQDLAALDVATKIHWNRSVNGTA